jgi:hypothetical protein
MSSISKELPISYHQYSKPRLREESLSYLPESLDAKAEALACCDPHIHRGLTGLS